MTTVDVTRAATVTVSRVEQIRETVSAAEAASTYDWVRAVGLWLDAVRQVWVWLLLAAPLPLRVAMFVVAGPMALVAASMWVT